MAGGLFAHSAWDVRHLSWVVRHLLSEFVARARRYAEFYTMPTRESGLGITILWGLT